MGQWQSGSVAAAGGFVTGGSVDQWQSRRVVTGRSSASVSSNTVPEDGGSRRQLAVHPAIQAGTCVHTRPGACAGRKIMFPQEVQCAAARPVPQRLARAGDAACGACARRSGRVESLCLQA